MTAPCRRTCRKPPTFANASRRENPQFLPVGTEKSPAPGPIRRQISRENFACPTATASLCFRCQLGVIKGAEPGTAATCHVGRGHHHPATAKGITHMLVLSRKVGERIVVGNNITITVVRMGQGNVPHRHRCTWRHGDRPRGTAARPREGRSTNGRSGHRAVRRHAERLRMPSIASPLPLTSEVIAVRPALARRRSSSRLAPTAPTRSACRETL